MHLYEDGAECSETSAYKIQTPGNYPEEIIQNSEQGVSSKSRTVLYFLGVFVALVMQHGMCMRHIAICGLPPLYSIFFQIIS
jgi:hypothetical protein